MHVKVAYTETIDPQAPTYYYQRVLKLALEKTRESHGDFRLSYLNEILTADRMRQMVTAGEHANLIWASVTPQRKKNMRVVPINLLRDFNNYRLLLVLSSNKNKLKDVTTLEQLQSFTAGNGFNWTDTKVLQANGIAVTTSVKTEYLVKMMQANRFDFISRGVHEIDNDLKLFHYANLAIAEGLVLKYKYPIMYSYFVNKSDTLLADRLEAGLQKAEEDGSFKKAFESIASYKAGIDTLNENRQVIELDNSLINP